jgi:hypothetical protein
MEVHPPHHTISTWRDFFVHMATICLGLLIALGLEQTVEVIHRAHQREQLREALDHDSRQEIADANGAKRYIEAYIAWLLANIKTVQTAIVAHQTPPPELPFRPSKSQTHYDVATDPAFDAAKASGTLGLLSQEDVRAYSEADFVTAQLQKAYDEGQSGVQALHALAIESGTADGKTDFSKLDEQQRHQYLELQIRQLLSAVRFRFWNQEVVALNTALLNGERDLETLQKVEHGSHTPIPGLSPHI